MMLSKNKSKRINLKPKGNGLEAEENLYTIEKKYKILYDASPDMYRTVDGKGIILECNKAYASNLGYTEQEIIGKSIFEHTDENSIVDLHVAFETWKRDGIVKNKEIWLKRKDGSTFPVLLSVTLVYDENGNSCGNAILKDMTEIFEAKRIIEERENLIRKQLERLREIEIQKDEFVSMITHELKTPLFPIEAHCELLTDSAYAPNLTEDQKDSVLEIYKNAKKLEKLIGDLLEAQKVEVERWSFKKDYFKISSFITGLSKSFKAMMDEQKVEFIINNNTNSEIYADSERLTQVFGNLITNALDFVPKVTGKIEIGFKENNNEFIFYVKDNGIGISKKEKLYLFKKFYQVDTSINRKHGGSGLGLVVCKGIVERMGGKIWVESNVGEGSVFYFSIPKKEARVEVNHSQ